MNKKKVTRSITAPMVYTDEYPNGLHLPGMTMSAAKKYVNMLTGGMPAKIVIETRVYEMDEETFVNNAVIRKDKEEK